MRVTHADPRNLTLSKLNMHYGEPDPDCADIIGSIRQKGVLVPLIVQETLVDGAVAPGHFEVVAGRRRWRSALAVIAEGIDVDDLVVVVLDPGDDAAAIEASLLENIARLPPGEVAQWERFVHLIKLGRTPEALAVTFGLSDQVVRRVLALGNLIPRLRELYRREEIDVATIRQLTLATKAQQKAWLDLRDDPDQREPRGPNLKAWLFGGEAISTSRAFFALDDYPGAIIGDLFGEESYFTDAALFWRCQNEAIAAKALALKAEGWADVEVLEVGSYFASHNHVPTPKDEGGKVFMTLTRQGGVQVHEGWLSAKEARKGQAARKAGLVGEAGLGGEAGEDGEGGAARTERAEVTLAQQTYIDLHRRAAVRAVLPDRPDVALRLMLAHVLAGSRYWRVESDPLGAGSQLAADSLAKSPAEIRFCAQRAHVLKLLGAVGEGEVIARGYAGGVSAVFAKLLSLPDLDVLAIAAVVMGETLAAGSVEVEVAGTYLAVDMGDYWSPDEAFFAGLKDREAINAMLREVGGKKVADGNLTEKVRTQKAILRDFLDGTGERPKVEKWLPRWLTFPAGAYTKRPFPPAQRAKIAASLLKRVKSPDAPVRADPPPA